VSFLNYFPVLESLGWLVTLMLLAVWVDGADRPERRQLTWLIGFGAARLFVAAAEVVLPFAAEWRQATAVLSGMLAWEFARRVRNESARARLQATTHFIPLECLLLVAAVAVAGGGQQPWSLPLDFIYSLLPALLGGGAILLLWRSATTEQSARRRAALRLLALGAGLYALADGAAGRFWGVLPPWIAALGAALLCVPQPAVRSRISLLFALGLLAAALLGPAAVFLGLQGLRSAEHDDVLMRAERAALPWRGPFAAQLAPSPLSSAARDDAQRSLEKLRTEDPLLHHAALWRFVDRQVKAIDLTTGADRPLRAMRPEEQEGEAHGRPFALLSDPGSDESLALAFAPLRPAAFENPAAWLVLEFPDVFWEAQRLQAYRSGIALVGALAAFCALGFVFTTRQQQESARQIQVQRLQAADKAKTEFLAFLSHELRTPLQTILGRTELLRADPSASAARHADAIESQGRLLLRLVTDLLDLGTIEAGALRLHPAPFSLRRLLATLEDTFQPLAAVKSLSLDVSLPSEVPDAWIGDEARLRQVLGNLLGNGIKYTSHGHVSLRVLAEGFSTDRSRLTFCVTDTGPGLPIDKIPQLFTLFTRLDDGASFSREGTGIGLALVRRLCALMGGTVSAANRAEGGAEFIVSIDLPRATESRSASATSKKTAADRSSVLVVEDNPAAREFLVEALCSLGHDAESVGDSATALDLLGRAPSAFDVVLLDVNLPGQDGVVLARRLRTQHPHLRLIGCSAEAFPHVRAAALAAGMSEFLVKPVTLDALVRAISPDRSSVGAHLFAKLQSPAMIARTRGLLRQEWPQLRAETEAALARGDHDAPRRLAHYLKATALLLDDAELLQLCGDLSDPSHETSTTLDRIALHLAEPLARVG
jgi:signal transduction histidine kinase/FixJ family two-component response regulator